MNGQLKDAKVLYNLISEICLHHFPYRQSDTYLSFFVKQLFLDCIQAAVLKLHLRLPSGLLLRSARRHRGE
jgi:hypothetical protein